MASKQTDESKHPKSLLRRKLAPMSGAASKRNYSLKHSKDRESSDGLNPKASFVGTVSSRSETASRRNIGTPGMSESKGLYTQTRLNRETACVDTLKDGFSQSFIDLFYLTHGKFNAIEMKDASLLEMKERLIHAERLNREGDHSESFNIYFELGSFFEKSKKLDAAVYFYNRSNRIANKQDLHAEEARAYQGLGSCYYLTQDVKLAIEMYERGVCVAETHGIDHILIKISKDLNKVYRLEAERLELEGHVQEALLCHEKCLESAKNAQEKISQGEACYRIGLIHLELGNYNEALEYLNQYYELSKKADYSEGVTNALAKLASTYQAMGEISTAIKYLEQLHTEASENAILGAEAEATLHLGLLYQKQGNNKKAVEFLEKHFSLARKLQDRALIDAARVNLGMAQANCGIEMFVEVVSDSLPKLIQWKNKRTKL